MTKPDFSQPPTPEEVAELFELLGTLQVEHNKEMQENAVLLKRLNAASRDVARLKQALRGVALALKPVWLDIMDCDG